MGIFDEASTAPATNYDNEAPVPVKRHTIVIAGYAFRRQSRPNTWDRLCTLIAITIGIGILALVLESVAYDADRTWNKILRSETGLPLTEDEYFKGKMLVMEAHPQAPEKFRTQIEITRTLLLRASSHELAAIILIVIFMSLQLLALLAYTQGEQLRKGIRAIHVVGAIFMFTCGMLIVTSDLAVDEAHNQAAASLEEYLNHLVRLFDLEKGIVGFGSIVNVGEFALMKEQIEIMLKIQNLCSLGNSKNGRYGYAFAPRIIHIYGQEYTLSQMRHLMFCSKEGVKFAAMFFCLIYSVASLGIAGYIYWEDITFLKTSPSESKTTATQDLNYRAPSNPHKSYLDFTSKSNSPYPTPGVKKIEEDYEETDDDKEYKSGNEELYSNSVWNPVVFPKVQEPLKEEFDWSRPPIPPTPELGISGAWMES